MTKETNTMSLIEALTTPMQQMLQQVKVLPLQRRSRIGPNICATTATRRSEPVHRTRPVCS